VTNSLLRRGEGGYPDRGGITGAVLLAVRTVIKEAPFQRKRGSKKR